jgi:uncharacterized oxidoreductase
MQIQADKLRATVIDILKAAGAEAEDADTVGSHLVLSNLSGHDSHGVSILPQYLENIRLGVLKPTNHLRSVRKDGSIEVFDGQMGFGQVVAREATLAAIETAKETGLSLSALRNAHHIGRVGTYGEMCAAEGLVSLHFVNVIGHRPLVAPHRGSDSRFATNPICISMPARGEEEPFILDFATSKVALGKIRVANNRRETVKDGLLINSAGEPTNNPGVMYEDPPGSLLPIAEHKGYGLAMACELLAGAIGGGGTIQPSNVRDTRIINNMLMIVIDPERLTEEDYIASEMRAMCDYARQSPPADETLPVLMPGEPEREQRIIRGRDGIFVEDETWRLIREGAAKFGMTVN